MKTKAFISCLRAFAECASLVCVLLIILSLMFGKFLFLDISLLISKIVLFTPILSYVALVLFDDYLNNRILSIG